MMQILFELFYRPFLNGLFLIYNYLPIADLGIAIVLLTLVVRFLLYPFSQKAMRNQTIMQIIQPKVKAIQEEHKNDREKQTKELLALYKAHKVNPFSGLLIFLVQIPVLIGLFYLFRAPFTEESFSALYWFVQKPDEVQHIFLGLINLYESSIIVVALAALFQFLQGWFALPKRQAASAPLGMAEQISRQMVFMGPAFTLFFFWHLALPSAVALYWLVTSLFSVIQQRFANKEAAVSLQHEYTGKN